MKKIIILKLFLLILYFPIFAFSQTKVSEQYLKAGFENSFDTVFDFLGDEKMMFVSARDYNNNLFIIGVQKKSETTLLFFENSLDRYDYYNLREISIEDKGVFVKEYYGFIQSGMLLPDFGTGEIKYKIEYLEQLNLYEKKIRNFLLLAKEIKKEKSKNNKELVSKKI